jgi:hypothetical protein
MRHFLLPILLGLAVVGAVGPWAPAQTANPDAAKASPPVNPQLALWLNIKRDLMGPHGKQYYESKLQNMMIPDGKDDIRTFRGTVVSSRPTKKPTELVLALSDDHTPEVTLTLRDSRENLTPLLRPIPPGTEILFYGLPVAFTQNPFMLTFEVKAENGPGGANPQIAKLPAAKAK